jgi:hypothetical protein
MRKTKNYTFLIILGAIVLISVAIIIITLPQYRYDLNSFNEFSQLFSYKLERVWYDGDVFIISTDIKRTDSIVYPKAAILLMRIVNDKNDIEIDFYREGRMWVPFSAKKNNKEDMYVLATARYAARQAQGDDPEKVRSLKWNK